MNFSISWEESALRDLENIDLLLRKRIVKKIEGFCEIGSFHEVRKVQGYEKVYRLRAGNYRVLFKLEGNQIIILKIKHRKNIY